MPPDSHPVRDQPVVLPGSPAPDFRAPTNKGSTLTPDAFEDRLAVVLVFLDGLESEDDRTAFWGFDALLPEFGTRRVQLLGVLPGTPREVRESTDEATVTVLVDEDGSIRGAFGAEVDAPFAVVVDRHGIVAAVLRDEDARPDTIVGVVDRLLEAHPDALEARPGSPDAASV